MLILGDETKNIAEDMRFVFLNFRNVFDRFFLPFCLISTVPMTRSLPTSELGCQPTPNENNVVRSVRHRTQNLNPLLTEEVERLALVVTAATAREAEIEAAERRRRQNSSTIHSSISTPSQTISLHAISHRTGSAITVRKCNTPLSSVSKSGFISPREDGLQNSKCPLVWCCCCMINRCAHDQSMSTSCHLRGNIVNKLGGGCPKTTANFVDIVPLSNQKQAVYSNTIAKSTATCPDLWWLSGQRNSGGYNDVDNKTNGGESIRSTKTDSPPLNVIDTPNPLQRPEEHLTSATQSAQKFVNLFSSQHFCKHSMYLTATVSNCAANSPCQQRGSIGVRPSICSYAKIASSRLCPVHFFRLSDAYRSRSMPLLNEVTSLSGKYIYHFPCFHG